MRILSFPLANSAINRFAATAETVEATAPAAYTKALMPRPRMSWAGMNCAPGPLILCVGTRSHRACFLCMIRKLKSGEFRLYSRKKNPKTGKRRNLGTFATRAAAEKHERAVQYFKRQG